MSDVGCQMSVVEGILLFFMLRIVRVIRVIRGSLLRLEEKAIHELTRERVLLFTLHFSLFTA